MTLQPLTPKEKSFLEYIEDYINENAYSPSYSEIKDHFNFASFNSVQRYLKQLIQKKYIHIPGDNSKRAITVLKSSKTFHNNLKNLKQPAINEMVSIPLLGKVAAGQPIEAFTYDETIDAPPSLVKNPDKTFALMINGSSMIDEGIHDNDIIMVEEQSTFQNGDIVVASIENESTLKKIFLHKSKSSVAQLQKNEEQNLSFPMVELRPSNKTMSSQWYSPEKVNVKGKLISLIRKF